jgi:hypothetical protein
MPLIKGGLFCPSWSRRKSMRAPGRPYGGLEKTPVFRLVEMETQIDPEQKV